MQNTHKKEKFDPVAANRRLKDLQTERNELNCWEVRQLRGVTPRKYVSELERLQKEIRSLLKEREEYALHCFHSIGGESSQTSNSCIGYNSEPEVEIVGPADLTRRPEAAVLRGSIREWLAK